MTPSSTTSTNTFVPINSELRQFRCRLAQQMVESGKHDRCTVPSSGEQDLYSRILISIHPPRLLFFPRLTQPFPMSHYPRKVGRTSDRPIRKDCLKPKTSMRLALSLDNSPTLCSSHRLPGQSCGVTEHVIRFITCCTDWL